MNKITTRSGLLLTVLAMLTLLALPLRAEDAGKVLQMTFSVRNGTGDNPMIVAWLETAGGDYVKTLQLFSKDSKYYKEMLAWRFKSKTVDKDPAVDAVSGATIKWSKHATISVPVTQDGRNLLDGSYVLRIESRKDKAGHYRNFKIPFGKDFAGGKFEDAGYVESIEIAVKDAAK